MELHVISHILQRAIEQSDYSIIITSADMDLDPSGPVIVYVNAAFERMSGYTGKEVIGKTTQILQGPATDFKVLERLTSTLRNNSSFRDTSWNYRKDGTPYKVEWSVTPLRMEGEGVDYFVSVQRELDELDLHQTPERLESETRRLNALLNSAEAHHDPITDALNHRGMLLHLQNLIDYKESTNSVTGLVSLHLRRLDRIDQAYGVEAINQLLIDIGERLNKQLVPGECLARSYEHTFSVLIPVNADALGDPDLYLMERARVFVGAIREGGFTIEGNAFQVEVGAGIARAPTDSDQAQELAVFARRAANTETAPIRWPDHTTISTQRLQISLESKLQHAVTERELILFYQPIVDLSRDKVVGAEALARWPQPEGQPNIGPDVFIPLAEELGLMDRLGMQIFEDACRQLRSWQELPGNDSFWVSVNVAPAQLLEQNLTEQFIAITQAIGVSPTFVKLEITESALEYGFEGVSQVIEELAAAGFPLALDDFGTGYSSLGRLIHMPFNIVKVDRTFVWEIPEGRGAGVVSSLSKLSSHLKLDALGEGVENATQESFLRDCGYRFAQGFHYAKPMAADNFTTWMEWLVA